MEKKDDLGFTPAFGNLHIVIALGINHYPIFIYYVHLLMD